MSKTSNETRMPLSPKENLLAAIRHQKPNHVPYAGEGAYRLVDHRGRKPPREGTDEWGVTWAPLPESYLLSENEPAASCPSGHPATRADELLHRDLPDTNDPRLFAGLLDGIDSTRTLVIGRHPAGPLDRFASLLDMPNAMRALIMEPDASQVVLARISDYHVGIARGYLAAGVEAGLLADDYAGQDGPFLRPGLWQRMILPGLERICAVYRDAGLPVFFHTCGRAEVFVPDLLAAGVDVFNLQSSACDLAALEMRFGRRIAFLGGIPSQLMQTGTPEDVHQAALAAMRNLGKDGGLILAPDQPLVFPAENEAALVATAVSFGRYPLFECSAFGSRKHGSWRSSRSAKTAK